MHMNQRRQDTKHHHCRLTEEPYDLVTRYIDGGIFVNFRRAVRRFTMIDTRHPLTLSYAPSLSVLKHEKRLHLIENYFMIHPLSMFSFYYNMAVAIVFIIYFIFIPICVALIRSRTLVTYISLPLNIVHMSLIIITFYTGHCDHTQNIVLMRQKDVVITYLLSYLFVDILAFMPQILRLDMIRTYINEKHYIYMYFVPLLIINRYARYIWCLKVLKIVRLHYGFSIFVYKATTMMLNIVVALVLAVYILYNALNDEFSYDAQEFLGHATTTVKMLFMVDYGRRYKKKFHLTTLFVSSVFILAGFLLHLTITVQLMEIWFRYFSAENQQNTVYNSIDAYMRYKALPVDLRKRIHLYLEFKYQGHFYKDSVIRKATSGFLRKEILLAATKESTQNVQLFQKIPGPILRKIRAALVSEIHLPGDVIIKAGTPGQCMFFLVAGTVKVTSVKDKVICYLRDGSHFGELAFIVNQVRVANVIAVSPCELFKLNRDSFWEIVKKYPELWKEIELMSAERIATAHGSMSSYGNIERKSNIQLTISLLHDCLKVPR